jgi:hypothetical protein
MEELVPSAATQQPGCNAGLPTVHADSLYRRDRQGVSSRCMGKVLPNFAQRGKSSGPQAACNAVGPRFHPNDATTNSRRHVGGAALCTQRSLEQWVLHPTRPGPDLETGLRRANSTAFVTSSSISGRRATLHLGTKPWSCEFPSTDEDDKPITRPPLQHAVALPRQVDLEEDEGASRGVREKGCGGCCPGYGGRSTTIKTHPKPSQKSSMKSP